MQRMKGQGTPVPNGPKDQSYTNPMTTSMAAAAASDPYMSSFYMTSTPYQAFGVGDGTWSNGSEHMQTFLGGYGGQVGYDSHSTIDGIFSSGNFGGFNAQSFNYGFHGNGDYSAWSGSDVRTGTKPYDDYYPREVYQDDRVKALDQGVRGLHLSEAKTAQDGHAANGPGGEKLSDSPGTPDSASVAAINQPKKGLSWASVASQPAKPQPSRRRDKSTMSSIVPGRHMDIGTWEGKNGGPKPVAPPPAPRPAWEAPRGGSRSTTSTTYSTPPPRTPPQTTPTQQAPPMPQVQSSQVQHSPTQQNHQQQVLLHQSSPQQQQLSILQQHSSQTSPMLQGSSMRRDSPQGGPYGSPSSILDPHSQGGLPPSPPNSSSMDDLQYHNEYNPKEFDMSPKNARFFVIKSYSEDDIHRSIKYEIWCSTEHGNKRLDAAFREREGKGPIYFFFSVNGSGHFCGIAQMMSPVDYNSTANVWAQDKWKGQFKVKWIYVKDVPNNPLRSIRLENNENKSVTNSRDTQEVPYEKGKQVLKIIHSYRHTSSIFDDFIHYEKRQVESEFRKGHNYKDGERDDQRSDSKDNYRSDSRGDSRGDPRMDQRGDSRGDPRMDQRGDSRGDPRMDQRGDSRGDPRMDQRGDSRGDARMDQRGDSRGDPRMDQHGDYHREHREFQRDYHRGGRGRGGHHRGGGRQ